MTKHIHRLLLALPVNPESLVFLQRLGTATHGNHPSPTRLRIIKGKTVPDPVDPNTENWQRVVLHKPTGKAYYVGTGSLTEEEWARIQSRIPYLPADLLYSRQLLNPQEEFQLVETNIDKLQNLIGTTPTDSEIFAEAGFLATAKPQT